MSRKHYKLLGMAGMRGMESQQTDSVARVSLWHIPYGSDYANARAIFVYFNNIEEAKAYADKYSNLPEMAILEVLK